MNKKEHDFHLVDPSPWPILSAFSLLFLTAGAVFHMHGSQLGTLSMYLGTIFIISCAYLWWRDVVKEGLIHKAHTKAVQNGLKIGMGLFIASEVMFFFAFFWSFFKAWLDPENLLDGYWPIAAGIWPPEGIKPFDPWDLPFINTLILLLSGTTVTWAHYEILHGTRNNLKKALGITIVLGISFTLLQAYEYNHAAFGLSDGIYASNFYLATGFHGAHVIIGTIFLTVCYFRAKNGHFDRGNNHLGFEFAAWYWHFVDVVWLFLFVFVYVWAR